MVTLVVGAIDQETTNASGAHLSEGDFLLAGEGGHVPIKPQVLFGVGSDARSASTSDPSPRAATHCVDELIGRPTRVTVGSRLGVKS
jgi:hypothetical protein